MKFLSNVIKTLSSLDSHAKKKMTNFSLPQQPNGWYWSYVVYVYQLYCVLIVMLHKWASVEKALNPHTRNLQQTHRRSGWLSATCTDLWTRAIARNTQSVTDRARERDILVKRKDVSKRYSHINCLPRHLNIGRDTNWSWKKHPPLMRSRGNRRRLINL